MVFKLRKLCEERKREKNGIFNGDLDFVLCGTALLCDRFLQICIFHIDWLRHSNRGTGNCDAGIIPGSIACSRCFALCHADLVWMQTQRVFAASRNEKRELQQAYEDGDKRRYFYEFFCEDHAVALLRTAVCDDDFSGLFQASEP